MFCKPRFALLETGAVVHTNYPKHMLVHTHFANCDAASVLLSCNTLRYLALMRGSCFVLA